MIYAVAAVLSVQLKDNIDPRKEAKLHSDELMRVVKLGGKTDYGKYRNVLVLKKDGMVINKAWNKRTYMKLNEAQWESYNTNLEYFPQNWSMIADIPKAKKSEMRSDRTEFYLTVRYKGKIRSWNSVGRREPWPFPLFDTTDVWEYLMKNP